MPFVDNDALPPALLVSAALMKVVSGHFHRDQNLDYFHLF